MASVALDCSHYKRDCSLVAPCCNKVYVCRVCHDDVEDHTLDRTTVEKIVCNKCSTKQPVSDRCSNCDIKFAQYFCAKCRLYDSNDLKQFHCDGCRLCRVGGRENYFHCEKCDVCLLLSMKDTHECLEKISHNECPVCLQNLHTSRKPSRIPKCRHMIHEECFKKLFQYGHFACPICGTSMTNMSQIWKMKDEEVKHTEMPQDYKEIKTNILCRDCHKQNVVDLHFLGLKCPDCGSYNTCQ
ncbi:RING finger and CHY zinc finger domain-containing protein 1 isoform X3 [Octopus bimaculoides]|uniref:RING finger and CHY zinc finger domain-containing protein 1 n=2 Tax=Octopus bimaculoides TaxID=37653 RepID=A0A0L8HTQ0_OCTBM|nr:RING finger and CHY zinc finger domain-containing protein 1 isoform X3 [Octopus bimaculoides]XP_052825928.1 RING finger and CHY zinc finger domain-containing protein 1 isoform X3 [Octopus bimaculoides]|eukprot:XP_014769475.1 PREDICTED: RING finger and CHY zinc finger domain-containing protein 1-like isoform X3 [Octopus bimaculoides]